MDDVSHTSNVPFKVSQIVCLEHQNNCLYGEVIQLIPKRQLCWFRPMCLVIPNIDEVNGSHSGKVFSSSSKSGLQQCKNLPEARSDALHEHWRSKQQSFSPVLEPSSSYVGSCTEEIQLIDLQSGSDLLWPAILFRLALDTEIIQIFSQLREPNQISIDRTSNQKCLNNFVQQVWRANQDRF